MGEYNYFKNYKAMKYEVDQMLKLQNDNAVSGINVNQVYSLSKLGISTWEPRLMRLEEHLAQLSHKLKAHADL